MADLEDFMQAPNDSAGQNTQLNFNDDDGGFAAQSDPFAEAGMGMSSQGVGIGMSRNDLGEDYTEEELARVESVRQADEQRKKDMWARQ